VGLFNLSLERHSLRLSTIGLLLDNLTNGSGTDARFIIFGLQCHLKVPCGDYCRAARNALTKMPFKLRALIRRQFAEQIFTEHPSRSDAGATSICFHAIEHLLSGLPLSPHAVPILSRPRSGLTLAPALKIKKILLRPKASEDFVQLPARREGWVPEFFSLR
jgi:hypothetical protein